MKPNVKEILISTYGEIPKPTPGQEFWHELMIDSGTFDEQELKTSIIKLAQVAMANKDSLTAEIALKRWNTLYPKNKYSSLEIFIGVEVLCDE